MNPKPFVITGGPGVGKTTVIELLRKRGYTVVDETAREIIEEEMEKRSEVLLWKDLREFQVQVFKRQLEKENTLQVGQRLKTDLLSTIFLDRSIIDGYAYCLLGKVAPSPEISLLAHGRYQKIFLLDRLPEYVTDASRIEDSKVAQTIHDTLEKVYADFGYDVVRVPVLAPGDRVDFILKYL